MKNIESSSGEFVNQQIIENSSPLSQDTLEKLEDDFSVVTNSVHIGPVVNTVEPVPDSMPPITQELRRGDGTAIKVRMPK